MVNLKKDFKKNKTTFFIKLSVLLMSAGILIFLIAFISSCFNIYALNSETSHSEIFEPDGTYDNISVTGICDNIEIRLSNDDKTYVECTESNYYTHEISVQKNHNNNCLFITTKDLRKWYDYWQFNVATNHHIIIYVPKPTFYRIVAQTTDGSIQITEQLTGSNIRLLSVNGNITVKNTIIDADANDEWEETGLRAETTNGTIQATNCQSNKTLDFTTTNGRVIAKNSNAKEALSLRSVNGDIMIDNSDAKSIYAETVNGSINGHIPTKKIYSASTVNGSVSVPGPPFGEDTDNNCLLTTINGNISIN